MEIDARYLPISVCGESGEQIGSIDYDGFGDLVYQPWEQASRGCAYRLSVRQMLDIASYIATSKNIPTERLAPPQKERAMNS